MKHTKEPWEVHESNLVDERVWQIYQKGCGASIIAMTGNWDKAHKDEEEANAKRIVECVNAMTGIEDPAKFMANIKMELTLSLQEIENPVSMQNIQMIELRLETALHQFPKDQT